MGFAEMGFAEMGFAETAPEPTLVERTAVSAERHAAGSRYPPESPPSASRASNHPGGG